MARDHRHALLVMSPNMNLSLGSIERLSSTIALSARELQPAYVALMMVRTHASLANDEEINDAAWVAARGAVVGAAKWGIFSAVAGMAGYYFSPVYKGLTFQFKVFLQMSGMTAGSMIEADKRLRAHEVLVRNQKKIARDAAVWRRYEEEYLGKGVGGGDRIAAESGSGSGSERSEGDGSGGNAIEHSK